MARAAFRIPFKGAIWLFRPTSGEGVAGGGKVTCQSHTIKILNGGGGHCTCRCELLLLAALQIRSMAVTRLLCRIA